MGYEFDEDTRVEAQGEGMFSAVLSERWGIGDRPNGGYLMAVGLRALGETLAHPHPLTATGHFLRPPRPGPAEIAVEIVRAGRTLSTATASLQVDGKEFLRVLATFGDLDAAEGQTALATPPPELPDPEDCVAIWEDRPVEGVTIAERLESRFPPGETGWAELRPSGQGRLRGWVRFADGRPPDPIGLVQFLDGLAPAMFDAGVVDPLPTIELTTHVRGAPVEGWVAFRIQAADLVDGFVEETASLWDQRGRLVATSRQLAKTIGWA